MPAADVRTLLSGPATARQGTPQGEKTVCHLYLESSVDGRGRRGILGVEREFHLLRALQVLHLIMVMRMTMMNRLSLLTQHLGALERAETDKERDEESPSG